MELADYATTGSGPLRRVIAMRAMLATGSSLSEVATAAGLSEEEVEQLRSGATTSTNHDAHPTTLLSAAAPVLRLLAETHGYGRLAVFGSMARGEATSESDIDLLVQPPAGTSSFQFVRFKAVLEEALGRPVDLVSYGALGGNIDDDIRREAQPL